MRPKKTVSSIPVHPSHLATFHPVGELLYLEIGGQSTTALVNLINRVYISHISIQYEVYSGVIELGITVIFYVYLGIPSLESSYFHYSNPLRLLAHRKSTGTARKTVCPLKKYHISPYLLYRCTVPIYICSSVAKSHGAIQNLICVWC